jgi:hypothetical protein
MKKKAEKTKKDSKEDVRSLLLHLESEYRKANISEKNYRELKEKYKKMLHEEHDKKESKIVKKEIPEKGEIEEPKEENKEEVEIEDHLKKVEEETERQMAEEPAKVEKKGFFKSLFRKKKELEKTENESSEQPADDMKNIDPPKKEKKKKEEEITEMTPEVIERLAQQVKEQAEAKPEEKEQGEKKSGGFFKSIFGKKKQEVQEPKETTEVKEPEIKEVQAVVTETNNEAQIKESRSSEGNYDVEMEKLKVMLDTVKESARVTDETIRNVSESIGEIRSMVFQADAELKENSIKMEKIEDDITEVRPQEIAKKFREFNDRFEKNQLELEMLERKASDVGEKINKVFEMLKSIGGIENLVNVNKEIQHKIDDVKEAMKYIERIGTKTEKIFVDLNKGLQNLVIIRAQQEDFNESLKDIAKNIDDINVKFEGYVTKKDLDAFREDDMLIKKQIENIKKVLPVVELKLPESIINLRKEREDIRLLLESLEEQYAKGKISKNEYETVKNANIKKLESIRIDLEKEWKKVEKIIKPPEKEGGEAAETEVKVEETKEVIKSKFKEKPEEKKKVEKPEEEAPAVEEKEKPPKEGKKEKKTKKEEKKIEKPEAKPIEKKSEKVEAEETEAKEEEMKEKNKIEELKKKMEDVKETFERKESASEETKAEEPKEEKVVEEEPEKEVVKKPKEEIKTETIKKEKPKEKKIKKKKEPHKVIKKVAVKKVKVKKPIKIKKKRKNIISEEKRKSEILKNLKRIR